MEPFLLYYLSMNKLVILSGVPGSGKSYFSKTIKKIKNAHVYVVSSDDLRALIGGSQSNLTNDKLMWKIFYGLAKVYAEDPDGVVVLDATNVTSHLRVDYNRELAKSFNEVDLVMWNIPRSIVSNQNLQREYPIPPEALDHFLEIFEMPTEKDKAFFDKIVVIENSDIVPAIEALKLQEM